MYCLKDNDHVGKTQDFSKVTGDLDGDLQRSCNKLTRKLDLWAYCCLCVTEWKQKLSSNSGVKLGTPIPGGCDANQAKIMTAQDLCSAKK